MDTVDIIARLRADHAFGCAFRHADSTFGFEGVGMT